VVDLDPTGVDVAQHHVGLAEAAEIAEAHGLPVEADVAEEGGAGDVIADVVDLEAAGLGVAQQHVGGVAAVEAAERDEAPIGSDLAQRVAGEDRIPADVVDLALARRGCAVRDPQDHVGGGAGRRRRVRYRGFEEAVGRGAGLAAGLRVEPDDLTCVVDAPRIGERYGRGIVDVGVQAAAIKEAVARSAGAVNTYDLAQIVDAIGKRGTRDGPWNFDGGEGAAAVEKGVKNV